MSEFLLLVPRDLVLPAHPPGALLVPFHTSFDAVVALKASPAPAIIVTDGLEIEDLDALAGAIRERGAICIEVRSARWDGETQSPVSAVCKGVVSGFGTLGIARAAEQLAQS